MENDAKTKKSPVALREEAILKFWEENKIFEKSITQRPESKEFIFYEGPPTANGKPGIHHVLARSFKDVICRYKTMRGFRVERKAGWDTHGLPVELQVEKELKISSKPEIEKYGIEKFNKKCRASVWEYKDDWEKLTKRIAFWLDLEHPYITYSNEYIESVWWILSEIYKKGLLYEGHKVVPYCSRCGTGLSSHEVAQGYKKIKDTSVYVKFKLKYRAGKTGRGVGALIYNDKGEILLVNRNEKGRRITWALPGGKVEANETFENALRREVTEELGVAVESAEPFNAKPDIFEGRLYETVCYKVKFKGEPKIMVEGELDKLKWFSLDDLPEIDYPPSRDAIETYKKNKNIFYFDINNSRALVSVYALVWTTTPWTLPGNVALAINKDIKYVMVKAGNDFYILAKDRIEAVFGNKEYEIVNEINGKDLLGLEYEQLFNFVRPDKPAFKVVAGDFVTTQDGSGIVHIAPAFGEDDMNVAKENNLPVLMTVNLQGKFTDEITPWAGKYVFREETNKEIINELNERGVLFKKEEIEHDYPFCWRCGTKLIYYAKKSWFIKMTDPEIKKTLIENNKKINWIPEYIKEGRMGEWLREIKDWALSRERYWGTPLPIWKCYKCKNIEVVNSIDDLRAKTSKKIMKIIFLRHGESGKNIEGINSDSLEKYPLTEEGIKHAEKVASKLKDNGIDIIITSPVLRTMQTAEIINKKLKVEVITNNLVTEYKYGSWNDKAKKYLLENDELYRNYKKIDNPAEKYNFVHGGDGESRAQMEIRIKEFVDFCLEKYPGKNILVVGHGGLNGIFKRVLSGISISDFFVAENALGYCESEIYYVDEKGREFNLHRPYIDEITFKCEKCGGEMKRVTDVIDCWFDSGSMPFAQVHWPFAQNQKPKTKGQKLSLPENFPADYISEAIDQTRGWFYTLLAISTLLGKGAPYKNVITYGHILDAKGQKMSKSKGNVVDPWEVADKYGIDVLRWYFYTVGGPGEPKRFDFKDLTEVQNKFFRAYWNSYLFFKTYGKEKKPASAKQGEFSEKAKSLNLLDKWIISRLNETISEATKLLDNYDIIRSARLIGNFVDDLSNWYIRRSRDRMRNEKSAATWTLSLVLSELTKLTAPFAPFISEEIYRDIKIDDCLESVHLSDWPKTDKELIDEKLNDEMEIVREIVSIGLLLRANAKKRVRQPLQKLEVENKKWKVGDNLLDLIRDELNVKEVLFVEKIKANNHQVSIAGVWGQRGEIKIALDIEVTDELREEGITRDIIRLIQTMRKDLGLTKENIIEIYYAPNVALDKLFKKWGKYIKTKTLAKSIGLMEEGEKYNLEKEVKVEGENFKIAIIKIK